MIKFLKKTSLFVILVLSFTLPPTMIINYILDPYGLLNNKNSESHTAEPNQRSLKNWHVADMGDRYCNFFFSNSRGGTYVFSDSSYYNMTYSMGVPWQFHEDIKGFLINSVNVNSVIIMIDEMSIFNNSDRHVNQPLRKKYKKNDVFSFLTVPLSRKKIMSILSFDQKKKHKTYNISKDGSQEWKNFKVNLSIDTVSVYVEDEVPAKKTELALDEIKNLVAFLKNKQIKYKIGIHPISLTNFNKTKKEFIQLKSLIKELRGDDVEFFNDLVIINDNNLESIFFDPSHYHQKLSEKVLEKCFKK